MKGRLYRPVLIGIMAVSLCCCRGKGLDESETAKTTPDPAAEEIVIMQETGAGGGEGKGAGGGEGKGAGSKEGAAAEKGTTAEGGAAGEGGSPKTEGTFSFADLKGQEFIFSSGAGGWGTWMMVRADGSFSGTYSDSDMGSKGEGYPNGTIFQSDFSGRFTEPEQVDTHTYSMQIGQLEYAEEIGREEIKDGILYKYADAYGLDGTKEILVHLPGTPLETLSEEVRSWIGYYGLSVVTDKELSFYVLENEAQGYGFKGYDLVDELREDVARTEEQAALLEASIRNDPLSQMELTEKTDELYVLWDSVLNTTWQGLKKLLDEDTMAALTVEEREWIKAKEKAVADAGAEFAGGSMQAMVMDDKAAEMTKARVYELLELLDK